MAKAKQKTKAQLRAELARNIASILANPETPRALFNAISDEITDWSTAQLDVEANTAPYIESSLNFYLRAEEQRLY